MMHASNWSAVARVAFMMLTHVLTDNVANEPPDAQTFDCTKHGSSSFLN